MHVDTNQLPDNVCGVILVVMGVVVVTWCSLLLTTSSPEWLWSIPRLSRVASVFALFYHTVPIITDDYFILRGKSDIYFEG
jgi:hypothetical protein